MKPHTFRPKEDVQTLVCLQLINMIKLDITVTHVRVQHVEVGSKLQLD